jgi:hypothetical protein
MDRNNRSNHIISSGIDEPKQQTGNCWESGGAGFADSVNQRLSRPTLERTTACSSSIGSSGMPHQHEE